MIGENESKWLFVSFEIVFNFEFIINQPTILIMSKSIVFDKSYDFSLSIIQLYKGIISEQKEFVLSKQVLRSGTAIGALLKEAEHAQSRADFLHKNNIALKEANETVYWLMLLKDSEYISIAEFDRVFPRAEELLKILISIVKTTKNNNK